MIIFWQCIFVTVKSTQNKIRKMNNQAQMSINKNRCYGSYAPETIVGTTLFTLLLSNVRVTFKIKMKLDYLQW
jgi:hypothetical protein